MRDIRANEATAEYIVDITTSADREGRANEFADAYEHSELKRLNDQQLQQYLKQDTNLTPKTLNQLQSKRATVGTLLRRPLLAAAHHSGLPLCETFCTVCVAKKPSSLTVFKY